ncbi:GntR family transcriptional regulator [Sphingomonas jatrophae]|uniref:Transcriptional regulator, GntR family n=1 Tax=Sphingomonas jatrophae TaxID=1166337 RepID=A0A1I6K8V3_9SPHN|nr:GntR family transcriptional regulator [Sphingomonas jatrophae]SFR87649.1 transcriptional regulator, GntR family [Sphingomonas jatrophae]
MANLAELIGPLDEAGRGSLYAKLRDALRDAIDRGVLKPQEALPPERDLATDFAISRITVRKALDALVGEGRLTRRQGAGTFVAGRVEKQFSKLSSFSEDMAARGRGVRSEWLSRAEGAVTPDEALTLGLSPGSAVYRFNRIRYADDLPMALEYATIPGFALDGTDVVDTSLYAALEASGMRPVRALQRLRAVSFTPEQAKLLKVEAGAPGLFIERRGFLDDGRAVEATRSWYRGDAYDFVAELNIRG